MAGVDREAFLWVVDHRAGWLDPLFIGLSAVGYAGLVWIFLAPALALLTRRPLLVPTALTAACVWGADLVALGLKSVVDRPRPFSVLPQADPLFGGTVGASLPSGHATTSFAGAVVLGYLFRAAAPALVPLALAVAFSRVYVGVHYPLDVLAGAAIGATVAALAVWVLRAPLRLSEAPRRRSAGPPPG